jgi:hypothetical protein
MPAKRYKPQRRVKPKTSRLKKVLQNRLFWFGMFILFVTGGLGYGIFFTPFFQIKHIEIQGNQKIAAEDLKGLTREYIPKKFLFFEMNNLFLANAGNVVREIQGAFPEIETVTVDTGFPDKVKVTVKERRIAAVWCQQKNYTVEVSDSPASEEQSGKQVERSVRQCFALDGRGVIFEDREPEKEVIVQGETSNAILSQQVIEPELLKKILAFQREMDSSQLFREVGLRVSSFSVVSKDRVNVKVSEGWEVYLNPTEDMDWQTTKAILVLEQEVPFQKRALLNYIDLRFGDQAYVKYR